MRQLFWLCLLAAMLSPAWADERLENAPPVNAEQAAAIQDPVADKPADVKNSAPLEEAEPEQVKNARSAQGHLIRIDLPITGDIDVKVRAAVSRILSELKVGEKRPVLIIELMPGQVEGGAGSDFGRAMSLAKFLASRDLTRLQTVAYVPKSIKGHAVLVAMACQEIVMAADAEIGDAGCDEQVIGPTIRSGYKEIADARSTLPAAVALAMLDGSLQALRVTTDLGTEYIFETELNKLKTERVVQNVEPLKPQPLLLDGSRAREMNLVSRLAADRTSLAKALQLPPEAVQDDPALAGGWKPVQVNVKGVVQGEGVKITQRKIEDQINENGVNLVVLWIDSDGGSFVDSMELANYLAGLDSSRIRTVAYIPEHAKGDAALIALACDQIVMGSEALIGGSGAAVLDPAEAKAAVIPLQQLVKKDKSRSWSLPAAMIDPQLKVYKYTQPSTGLIAYFCEDELAQQADPASWRQDELVTKPRGPLALTGREAETKGIAWKLVENFEQFKQNYGLQHSPALVEPGWADFLIQALSSDGARIFLLVLGFAGLYLEINTPGIGLGSFVALVAFMLYFWAQHLQGTANTLEIMLFLAGVLCVAIEILLLPGVGIFGLGGGLMMIASLVLASQTFVIPGNEYQLAQMRNSLLVLGGSVVGIIGVAIVARRFLPHTPGLSRMLLAPPSGEELEALSQRESLADFRHLVGRQGIATTRLVLSGKAKFGDELVDVIAHGEPIDRGAQVEVVEVAGSRVVVREVRET